MNEPSQPCLFDAPIPVNSSVDAREEKRLSRQSQEILDRLCKGPATNAELAVIGIRYSARIGELRAVGYQIEIVNRDFETGLNTYAIKSGSE